MMLNLFSMLPLEFIERVGIGDKAFTVISFIHFELRIALFITRIRTFCSLNNVILYVDCVGDVP